jgi:hypothetical protein
MKKESTGKIKLNKGRFRIFPYSPEKEETHSLLSKLKGKDIKVTLYHDSFNYHNLHHIEGRVDADKYNRYSLFQGKRKVFSLEYHSSRRFYYLIEIRAR